MYFVVMRRVNLIVIPMTYVRYLYSINCPTVIWSPSMLLFILWRYTTIVLWTPVQFLLHCYSCFTFTRIIYILANYYLLPLDTLNPLFIANRWDWQPYRKLGQSTWLCYVQVPRCCWWRSSHINYASVFSGAIVQSVVKLASINLLKFGFLLLVWLILGFTTEGNLLLCSSYLPLGVPNWVPTTHHQAFFWRHCRGERRFL
jgi:hypothetical protein